MPAPFRFAIVSCLECRSAASQACISQISPQPQSSSCGSIRSHAWHDHDSILYHNAREIIRIHTNAVSLQRAMALGTYTYSPLVIIARLRRIDIVNIRQYRVDGLAAARVRKIVTTSVYSNPANFMAQALRLWPSKPSCAGCLDGTTMTTIRSTATVTV